jgi:ankyrin repeat protein
MLHTLSLVLLLSSLQLGAQPPSTGRLFETIRSGNTAALEQQLSAGASPNDSLDGYSALMAATLDGSAEQMLLLIRHGANVNFENSRHITAIWLAVPDREKVSLLLDHGADVNHPVEGYTVLTKCATSPGSADLIRLLISGGADPRKSAPDNSLLYEAAESGDTAILGLVLRLGFHVNDTTAFGDYPINSSLSFRTYPTLKMLVDSGADVNARSMYLRVFPSQVGITPVMAAALNADRASVDYLLDHGADPNLKTRMGMTALMFLQQSETDEPDITLDLLRHGADPAVKMPDGSDARSFALRSGFTKSAALLNQNNNHQTTRNE